MSNFLLMQAKDPLSCNVQRKKYFFPTIFMLLTTCEISFPLIFQKAHISINFMKIVFNFLLLHGMGTILSILREITPINKLFIFSIISRMCRRSIPVYNINLPFKKFLLLVITAIS